MLLLGFLRSVAPLLKKGPMPVVMKARKSRGDDSDDEGEPIAVPTTDAMQEDEADVAGNLTEPHSQARGTVLITLRNVRPYTEWQVYFSCRGGERSISCRWGAC